MGSFSLIDETVVLKRPPWEFCEMPIEVKLKTNVFHRRLTGDGIVFYFRSLPIALATSSWTCGNRETKFGVPTIVGLSPS